MSNVPHSIYPSRIGIRLAPEHKAKAERAARAAGLSLSDYLRLLIERDVEPPRPPARLPRRPGT